MIASARATQSKNLCRCSAHTRIHHFGQWRATTSILRAPYRYAGPYCEKCADGRTDYPECLEETCYPDPCTGHGSCDAGQCSCDRGFAGEACDSCAEGFMNYPECNDNPCEPDPCQGASAPGVQGTCDRVSSIPILFSMTYQPQPQCLNPRTRFYQHTVQRCRLAFLTHTLLCNSALVWCVAGQLYVHRSIRRRKLWPGLIWPLLATCF